MLETQFVEVMDVAKVAGYKPPPEFQEDARDPLVELNLTDSTELWLIQWPVNQVRLLVTSGSPYLSKIIYERGRNTCELN